jgi:hypothetical protein
MIGIIINSTTHKYHKIHHGHKGEEALQGILSLPTYVFMIYVQINYHINFCGM